MSAGKKILVGFLSTLAWPVLLAALLVTSGNLVLNNLAHAGDLASTVVREITADRMTLSSLIDEYVKSADPKVSREIIKNRRQIENTLLSLGSSPEFEKTVSSTLNRISEAALSGASAVYIDFAPIVDEVTTKVNESAKSTVISKKNLANLKPTVIDLSRQSKTITQVKKALHMALLVWVLWLLLLVGLYSLTGKRIIRTFGIHFITIGVIGLTIRFVAPVLVRRAIENSDGVLYVQQAAPKILSILLSPIMNLSVGLAVIGIGLTFLYRKISKNALATS